MKYLCLLRGVNVGGKNLIKMKELQEVLTGNGYEKVITYINSGNIIFDSYKDRKTIENEVATLLYNHFNIESKVLVITKDLLLNIAKEIPDHYQNNNNFKSDVLIFMDNAKEEAQKIKFRDNIEEYKILDDALIYGVLRVNQNKSSLTKIVGTPFYQLVTIRNVNTVRKLAKLIND